MMVPQNSQGFAKAVKQRARLRLAIDGPSGAGKTYTALVLATMIAKNEGKRIAFVDTERGSASLYADKFDFDVLELNSFSPKNYTNAIISAEESGLFSVIVLDSMSHAWEGEGGALDMVDKSAKRMQTENRFVGWKDVTPVQREMVDTMLMTELHVIGTMRSKMEYVLEKNGDKTVVRKVGMAPIQRQGMEYEFTLVGDMDTDHNFIVSKTRIEELDGWIKQKPTERDFQIIMDWLKKGEEIKPQERKVVVPVETKNEKPAVAPAPAPSIKRPYTPDQLKERLYQIAQTIPVPTTPIDTQVMVGVINDVIDSVEVANPIGVDEVLEWLSGEKTFEAMPENVVATFSKWMSPKLDNGMVTVSEDVTNELLGVVGIVDQNATALLSQN
jgi:energy-coupling factor transporter ATP-binding protein EcfA2